MWRQPHMGCKVGTGINFLNKKYFVYKIFMINFIPILVKPVDTYLTIMFIIDQSKNIHRYSFPFKKLMQT